tara:strand:+ start:2723 stop:3055 length:333 start_codon:yes stop_codon:yes gene_type:complete
MADGRKKNKGQKGAANRGGRPTKSQRQTLVTRLSPMDDVALLALKDALLDGQGWAVKLFLQYRLGMPKQSVSVETVNSPFTPIQIDVIRNNSTEEDSSSPEESENSTGGL